MKNAKPKARDRMNDYSVHNKSIDKHPSIDGTFPHKKEDLSETMALHRLFRPISGIFFPRSERFCHFIDYDWKGKTRQSKLNRQSMIEREGLV